MMGVIESYRRGVNVKKCDSLIVVLKEKTPDIIGKRVIWTSPSGRRTEGKVVDTIGNKGNIIAKFEYSLPGQAIGTQVEII